MDIALRIDAVAATASTRCCVASTSSTEGRGGFATCPFRAGKAFYDCELTFAHEGVFIGCALFSALFSTHKNMVKVLK